MFFYYKKYIRIILVIILTISIFHNHVSATDLTITKLDASSPFNYMTDRITQTFLDKDNSLYTLDWTGNEENNSIGNYIIRWSNAKRTVTKLKMPKVIKEQIISGMSAINTNEIMSNGNILLSWAEDAGENGVYNKPYYVAVISPNGDLKSKIKLNDIFKIQDGDNDEKFYYTYPYKKNRIVVVCTVGDYMRYDDNTFIGVINYKTGKLVWQRKMSEEEGWDRSARVIADKYIIGYNNDNTGLCISDIRNGDIVQKINIEKYDVEAFEYKNKSIYIAMDNGIYRAKWKSKNIKKIISIPKNHWLRKNTNTSVQDITVVNDKEVYVCGCKNNWKGECRIYQFKKVIKRESSCS